MESIFFQMFEIATPTTTANVYSGEPGTAKSMRFKRFKASMSPGLVVNGGNKSARAGMQGARAVDAKSPISCAHALTRLPQATTTPKTAASCTPTR